MLAGNKRVAVKVQKLTPESQSLIIEEYKILRDFGSHPNLPDFYGIYRRRTGKKTEYDQIWFVMEVRIAYDRGAIASEVTIVCLARLNFDFKDIYIYIHVQRHSSNIVILRREKLNRK